MKRLIIAAIGIVFVGITAKDATACTLGSTVLQEVRVPDVSHIWTGSEMIENGGSTRMFTEYRLQPGIYRVNINLSNFNLKYIEISSGIWIEKGFLGGCFGLYGSYILDWWGYGGENRAVH